MAETKELTAEEIGARVRPYVDGRMVGKIRLTVDEAHIYPSNGYWRVPVRPSVWPNPLFPYYEALAEIEDEVQSREGLKVIISTGEPTDEE